MLESNSLTQRKQAIERLIQQALYCLNIENNDQKKELEVFLNSFFSMQGPEFFLQLNDQKTEKAYAGAMCDLWHFFELQHLDNKVGLSFFDHPYQKDQTFLSIISRDCSYILKTIHHILKKKNIKIKNIMHPVLHTKRDDHGRLINLIDDDILTTNESFIGESVIHFLIVTPLTEVQKEFLKLTIEKSFIELYTIDQDVKKIEDTLCRIKNEISLFNEEEKFLNWLKNDRYHFYGYRFLKLKDKQSMHFIEDAKSALGLLTLSSLKNDYQLTPLCSPDKTLPLVRVYKSSLRSNINRGSRYDCLEIPYFDEQSNIVGFHQFIGVFTPDFFESSPIHAPLARVRASEIFKQFKFDPNWYNGKLLSMIMDSISLDLFFQLDNQEISDICQRVLEIQNGVVTFIKPNKDDDYILVLLYMPFEKYSFPLKDKIKAYFQDIFKGNIYSEHILIGEYPFARLVFVIDRNKEIPIFYDTATVQSHLCLLAETWDEKLEKLVDFNTASMISKSFPEFYKKDFAPDTALKDYEDLQKITPNNLFNVNLHTIDDTLRIHLLNKTHFVALSSFLSILERFGLKVFSEKSYVLNSHPHESNETVYLQVFYIEPSKDQNFENIDKIKERFLETLTLVWTQKIKDDLLNSLILLTPFNYKDLMLIRTFSKALCQIGIPYSNTYILETLSRHLFFIEEVISLFKIKFDPTLTDRSDYKIKEEALINYCNDLKKVDEDRILRRFLNLITSSLRTNFYQKNLDNSPKDYISVKFDCASIIDLPTPKPLYEIYVYSLNTEGVHLRAGKVSRGGIRWSDRLEDFRSEILGLVKAQTVKNSVIVPLGAKGGFIVKRYETAKENGVDHHHLKAMVVDSYRTFISGLLDITDNFIQNKLVKPKDCICYDDKDPYLVVAADKGTATFSDVANELAHQYNFWLGDAFASGGSHGYDHKKMGITAKGAWICTQRHFLEQGIDIQKDSISVIGIGDMAGDVFGNGMLQSNKIKLVAAFNHEHIFLDPNPSPTSSFEERKRLFKLSGSKWSDYNTDLISEGGGVYSRQEKFINLSKETCDLLNIPFEENIITPDKLIQFLLKAPVDLLFFGGIGTFIKAQNETDLEVKDKANDMVRINGNDVRAKVIAEGANLGVTQKGRIEYALSGGRINMDAVDNSAGVDCSDHEVNIKIFFNNLIQKDLLTLKKRDQFLVQMTDNVAELVLKDNHEQSFLLSVIEKSVIDYTERYKILIDKLASNPILPLDVNVEFLPSHQELAHRFSEQKSFTRPELSILISYAKLHLYQELLNNLDTDNYHHFLNDYFPKIIVKEFGDHLPYHPLKKEIICTFIANDIINHIGISFLYEVSEALGITHTESVVAILKLVDLLDLRPLWNDIKTSKNLTIAEKYQAWEDIINSLQKILFSYLQNKQIFQNDESLKFKNLFESFKLTVLKGHKNTKDDELFKKRLSSIDFIPICIEIYQHHDYTDHDQNHFLNHYIKISELLDFPFLITLINTRQNHHEWERTAHYLLCNELFKIMVQVVYKTKDNKPITHLLKNESSKIHTYNHHLSISKMALTQDNNVIAIISYMTRHLSTFLRND